MLCSSNNLSHVADIQPLHYNAAEVASSKEKKITLTQALTVQKLY